MTLLGIMVLCGLAGEVYWLYLKHVYGGKAAKFDMKRLEEMEAASVIYDRNNNVLGKIFIQNRDPRPLEDFPDILTKAVVSAEDTRFWQHHGADYYGMARAWVRNHQAGHIRQGASTLTQQLARNTFPAELPSNDKSYDRKILEVFVAERIEQYYTKNKILEMYLNRVYFGSGFYGAETAARGYFGKDAKDLNLSECATLASLLRNPNSLSPWSNRKACIDARNGVLKRMWDMKYIDEDTYKATIAEDLIVKNRKTKHTESYALDLIRGKVEKEVGADNASSGGYRIYTTIDGDLQKKAQESVQRQLTEIESHDGFKHQTYEQYQAIFRAQAKKAADSDSDNTVLPSPEYLQGSVVAVDNASGGIVAIVGGRDFDHSQFQREFSRRPAGTAFIPLVYAAAFERGIFPGALFMDSVMDNRMVMIGGTEGILGEWGPERVDNRYEGFIPARFALVKSKNAATVRVGMATGIDSVMTLAKNDGIASPLRPFPATYLGSSDVSLMEMTMAYTMFPNGGWKPVKPFIIKRIEDKDGRVVFEEPLERKQVVKATTAYEVHSCLSEVLEWGTGDKAFSKYGLRKLPFAGKTGTAYNFTDEWFVGYSDKITCGVWAGFDKPQQIYRGAFSSDIALPIWVDIMNASASAYPPKEIEMPRGLSKYKICSTSGLLATDKCFDTTTDPVTGATVQHSTAYYEIGTLDQVPKDYCMHGEGGPKNAPQAIAGSGTAPTVSSASAAPPSDGHEVRRATLASDPTSANPVQVKAQAVLGDDDPYRSIKARGVPDDTAAAAGGNNAVAENPNSANPQKTDVPVKRAEPVRPGDDAAPDSSTIKVDAPPPVDF